MNKIIGVILLVLIIPFLTGCNEIQQTTEDQTTEESRVAELVSDSEVTSNLESDWSDESDNVEIGEMI